MYVLVTHVNLDTSRDAETVEMLNSMVVPQAKATPGFKGGYWMRTPAHDKGMSFELFETEDAAKAAADTRDMPPAEAPVTIVSIEVMTLEASA